MQFLSAARAPNVNQSCREITSKSKNQDIKHMEDNFPAQRFQKAFQMGLSQSKRCFSSRVTRFSCGHPNTGIFGLKVLTNGKQVFSCPALWITFRKRLFRFNSFSTFWETNFVRVYWNTILVSSHGMTSLGNKSCREITRVIFEVNLS